MAFVRLSKFPSIFSFQKLFFFIINGIFLSNGFFWICWNDHMVLLLCSVNRILYRNLFSNIKPILVMMYYPFYVFVDWIYLIFIKDVCIYNHERYWYIVFLFYNSLFGIHIKLILASLIRFRNVSFSSIFWKNLCRIRTVFFFNA